MIKIDFNRKLRNYEGNEHEGESNAAKSLCVLLGRSNTKDGIDIYKVGGWIEKLQDGGVLDLDEADVKKIRSLAEESDVFDPWYKYQFLKLIDEGASGKSGDGGRPHPGKNPIKP